MLLSTNNTNALDVFGYDKTKIQIEWIGRNVTKGKSENTGKKA